MKSYRILTINPGSTSTKMAVFENEKPIYTTTVNHDAAVLKQFAEVSDQFVYRKEMITKELAEKEIDLSNLAAVVGRGGGLISLVGGVYPISDLLLDHAVRGANGIQHPAQLGPQLALEFARESGCPAFVVNPPDTDELEPVARITGIKGVYRHVHLHALNQKETAIRHANSLNRKYEECNFIVVHMGGGISVAAHQKGRMIDGNDIVGGEGPMAPTRCGAIPAMELIKYCFSGSVSEREAKQLCTKTGGFVSHLGIADAIEVLDRIAAGDQTALLLWQTMIYQIQKEIGSMAGVLAGKVDGILLAGGMAHSHELVETLRQNCQWIAPVSVYPGEFELEAMASGAIRVLRGEETAKEYTGMPVWQPQ